MNELLKDIDRLLAKYKKLGISQSDDWEKYNHFMITHHSTNIEGSSLTEEETQLLLEEDITAKGKPMAHHHMVKDHYNALQFVLKSAEKKQKIDVPFIQQISSLVLLNTGEIINTIQGKYDSSKGDLRLSNLYAGQTRFVDFTKVPQLLDKFCYDLNKKLNNIQNKQDALITAFDAHYNLVTIHPFRDGNGRVSRLMMNYVLHQNKLPLANIFKEDKAEYYKALVDTRKNNDVNIFREFMSKQYSKQLKIEINKAVLSEEINIIKQKPKSKGMGMGFFIV